MSGLAIAGFVCAFLLAPIGIILSAIALGGIGASKGQLRGRGLAVAGLVVGIAFSMLSLLAAIAIPSFLGYMQKSKLPEVRLNLRKIEKSVKAYYIERAEMPQGNAPLTPAAPCCANPDRRCAPDEFMTSPAWQAIDFEPFERTRFQYSYTSSPTQFTATAVGDPSCDGNPVTYQVIIDVKDGMPVSRFVEPTD